MKNRRKQNFEGETNKVQLDKEDTRRSKSNGKCIFNILILLLFISCSISLLVKYAKCYKSAKPIAFQRNLLGKLPRNRPFFLPIIFQRNWPRKSREFAAKSAIFSANLSLKIPRNLTFFPATYQKPWFKDVNNQKQ